MPHRAVISEWEKLEAVNPKRTPVKLHVVEAEYNDAWYLVCALVETILGELYRESVAIYPRIVDAQSRKYAGKVLRVHIDVRVRASHDEKVCVDLSGGHSVPDF